MTDQVGRCSLETQSEGLQPVLVQLPRDHGPMSDQVGFPLSPASSGLLDRMAHRFFVNLHAHQRVVNGRVDFLPIRGESDLGRSHGLRTKCGPILVQEADVPLAGDGSPHGRIGFATDRASKIGKGNDRQIGRAVPGFLRRAIRQNSRRRGGIFHVATYRLTRPKHVGAGRAAEREENERSRRARCQRSCPFAPVCWDNARKSQPRRRAGFVVPRTSAPSGHVFLAI